MSGLGGGPAALAQGLSPLDGMLVPTFGAYDLAVTFLFPFVAIRLVASERESGASKLLAQAPIPLAGRMAVKGGVLLLGWLLAWIPALLALLLWRSCGGHLAFAESANLGLGHLLHALLAAGVAMAAASVSRGGASAAIATLGFTVGTWALDFVAAGREGWWARLAPFTPTAALRSFEHGELRLSVAGLLLAAGLAGFAFAALWLDPFRTLRRRAAGTFLLAAALAAAATLASGSARGWDLSEDRRNSFSRADEDLLRRTFGAPGGKELRVTAHLAAEDPRRADLERNVLAKLGRVVPGLRVDWVAESRTGLFEDPEGHYGEVWYQVGDRRDQLRSTIEPVVLAKLYELAGAEAPAGPSDPPYPGYPLAARPGAAAFLFYAAWPLSVGLAFFLYRRPWRSR